MRIQWKDKFKDDYTRLEKTLKKSDSMRKALFKAIRMLQEGEDLSEQFIVNRIPAQGQGWYVCYFYKEYVVIYKLEKQYVKLSRLGAPKELEKERDENFF